MNGSRDEEDRSKINSPKDIPRPEDETYLYLK
jgi:hypothetical protein